MTNERPYGEIVFEAYLAALEGPEPEHEPDLGIEKRPDYLVRCDGLECVCEVKEFNPDKIDLPLRGSFGTTSVTEVLKPIRAKIRAAAKQLKPLAGRDLPLVVVLTNPHGAFVPMSDQEIVWAMYGDPVYTMEINTETGAAVGDGRFTTDKHGKLRNDHPYISAIVVIGERTNAADFYDKQAEHSTAETKEERWEEVLGTRDRGEVPEGSYYRADCFKTMSPEATPLPQAFFDGPNDRLFDVDLEENAYIQVRGREFSR